MEVILVFVVLAVVVLGAVATVSVRRRSGSELEPPPPRRPVESGTAPSGARLKPEADAAGEADAVDAVEPTRGSEVAAEGPAGEAAAAVVPVEEASPATPEVTEEAALRPRFRDRLGKARALLSDYVGAVLSRSTIDSQVWDDLEEALIRADVGVGVTARILDDLRAKVGTAGVTTPTELLAALKDDLKEMLATGDRRLSIEPGQPNVWLFVGVNGVGKTTTIGKLGRKAIDEGHTVVMAAGDTFRAAAADQLQLWAERVGADIVRGAEGGDPASVVFDAVQRAGARGADLVLADTAGRLHNKVNLMEELKKVRRVAEREPGRVSEVLLVIDATTGQNGLVQAKQFTDAVQVTGIVLTKLDGTAKGGIALAIQGELGIPIKLVGLGEGPADLVEFDPSEFVDALFE